MRQMYFQQGGSDPAILAQIADMEREARTLDNKGVKARRKRGRDGDLIKSHAFPRNSHIILLENTMSKIERVVSTLVVGQPRI